jgi:hypothetical protein
VPISSLVDATGAAVGTAGAPLRIDPTGTTTQPVSAAALPLPAGAATAVLQGTNTNTTAHTCSVAGFSEIGCLGQIDDDVKAPIPAGTARIGYVSDDPCTQGIKTNVPISTATGTVALVTGVSAKKIYVCSFSYVASAADAVSLAEGSSSTCGTSNQAAVIGVATNGTQANGLSFAANGGMTLGNGTGTIASTATAANYLCLFHGAVQGAGNLTYVQQ